MKTRKNRKRNRLSEFRESIRQSNLMNRFIHEIEREEPLEQELLKTMMAYELQTVK